MPEHRAEQGERVVDVVAVADEREDEAVGAAEALAEREQVGERLARVLAERQAVDHRDRRLGGELDDDLVGAGPGDDRVDEPLEVAGDVADALAGAHDDVLGQVDRVAAELVHPGLERHARPQARLLEEHRQRPPGERRGGRRAVSRRARSSALSAAATLEEPQRPRPRARSATDRRSRPRRDEVAESANAFIDAHCSAAAWRRRGQGGRRAPERAGSRCP